MLRRARRRCSTCPGVFVFGSNDYYSPTLRNPLRYLLPDDGKRNTAHAGPALARAAARRSARPAGSTSPTARDALDRRRDDVRVRRRRRPAPRATTGSTPSPGRPTPDADVRLAVAHAPYLRVLDQFAGDGYDAIVAGHTHGGQVCLPGVGALTTNCDLEPARAKGLHRHPADSRAGDPGSSWLHVSAGARHQPVRPDPGRLPPRGDAADPRPARLIAARPARFQAACRRSGMLAVLVGRPVRSAHVRAVAQLGSAPRSGRGGRRFKSCQPDQPISCDHGGSNPSGSARSAFRDPADSAGARWFPARTSHGTLPGMAEKDERRPVARAPVARVRPQAEEAGRAGADRRPIAPEPRSTGADRPDRAGRAGQPRPVTQPVAETAARRPPAPLPEPAP